MQPKRSLRAGLAIAVSVALHVCLIAYLTLQKPPPLRTATPAAQASIHWVEAVKPPEPALTPKQPTKTPREKKPVTDSAAAPAGAPKVSDAPALATAQPTDVPYAQPNAPHDERMISKLVPNIGTVMRLPGAADAEGPHGVTIRNDPTERPDPVALGEYEGEQLSRKLNVEISQDLARAMAGAGNVPPFFKRIEKAMREKISNERVKRSDRRPGDVARDVARTMAPSMDMTSANKVADSPLGRSVQNGVGTGSATEDQRFRESAMQSMAWSQTVADRASAVQLRTVVELTQDARGVLADVRVLEKSGDPVFDESVMHYSRKIVRELPDSDEQGLGTKWWLSRWQFTWEPPNVRVKLMEAYPFAAPVQ